MQGPLVEVETLINANAARVWETMTRRSSAMFMGATVDTDWTVGHPITFTGNWKGRQFQDHGVIESIEEGLELSFTHFSPLSGKPDRRENYNLVRYTLEPAGESTKVRLSQTPLAEDVAATEEQKAEFRKNWTAMLQGLKSASERAA